MTGILPCPFCGGDAEMDTLQAYRNISTGHIGHAAAVYCTACSVQVTHCYEDHIGTDREDLQADLVGIWNRRAAVSGYGEVVEALRRVDHTLSIHGHVDADTELHEFVGTALSRVTGAQS